MSCPGGIGNESFGGSHAKSFEIVNGEGDQANVHDDPSRENESEIAAAGEEKNPGEIWNDDDEEENADGRFAAALKFEAEPDSAERDGDEVEKQNASAAPHEGTHARGKKSVGAGEGGKQNVEDDDERDGGAEAARKAGEMAADEAAGSEVGGEEKFESAVSGFIGERAAGGESESDFEDPMKDD